jgi:Domain of unknown function (DUF4932)
MIFTSKKIMQKIVLITVLVLCGRLTNAQLPGALKLHNEKLNVLFSKNVELLGFGYFIAFEANGIESKTIMVEGQPVLRKDWHNYGYNFYLQYRAYAASTHIERALTAAGDLWLDYLTGLLLQLDDFPNARITAAIHESWYIRFSPTRNVAEAREKAGSFINALNEFYQEVNFDTYLKQYRQYYAAALKQIKDNLPETNFITAMEAFYKHGFHSYWLVPSLTIPKGMAFGPSFETNGVHKVFNVFGAFDKQQFLDTASLNMGFGRPAQLRELSVHEFGHSFVNPKVYQLPDSLLENTKHLFDTLRAAMEEQGYNTWRSCVIEHAVRAGEVVVARAGGRKKDAARLQKAYIYERRFLYLPLFIKELEAFRNGRHPGLYQALYEVMKKLERLPAAPNNR